MRDMRPTTRLTRRQLLRAIWAGSVMAALAPHLHARAHYPTRHQADGAQPASSDRWVLMGRAIHTVRFYAKPSTDSELLETRTRDQGFRLSEEVIAPYSQHNNRWYRTELGYVHSAWVLPMRVYPPQPFIPNPSEKFSAWGFWGQVSQLYTAARLQPNPQAGRRYRIYGGTVYHVVDAYQDDEGTGWYKIVDDYPPKHISYQWVLARDMRRIPRQEMSPIHPFVGDKRIEVSLTEQRLTCYEGQQEVYTTLVASGLGGDLNTPVGEHCVLLKQASRHMSNVPYEKPEEGEEQEVPTDIFDLPGVPWNIFFDLSGTAIHGTYWHNDFGIRRSHGCLNVPCEAARWVYRWVHPIGGYEDAFIQSTCRVGTPIIIRQ